MFEDMYKPKMTKVAKRKIKKFQALKSENGFAIAYGILLLAVSKKYVTLDELHDKYNSYIHKFSNKYYIMPVLGGNLRLEDKLDHYIKYDYIDLIKTKNNFKYKITSKGESLIPIYIQDKEIFDLLK